MKCLVTGAAGFIGSHLCERLLKDGHEVVGLDAFIPLYDPAVKHSNLTRLRGHANFTFGAIDLRTAPLEHWLDGVEVVYHLAAMAGLTRSWSEFDLYESCNLTATQRLVKAVARRSGLDRFVYASTSSVYGRFASGDETLPTRPISPYGVTKLAAENLCRAYAEEHGLPLVVLRYFSVYGPRQRPDMGYHRFVRAMLAGDPITVCGDGMQVRGNTYIDDCIEATVRSAGAMPGETYNVGGGEAVSVWDVIRKLEDIVGRRALIQHEAARPGDQRHTCADTGKLARHLDWHPRIGIDEGLRRQVAWQKAQQREAMPRVEQFSPLDKISLPEGSPS